MREKGREGWRWCSESCHWCENSMERRQTLEAIFTSSANSDRLPPARLRRISASLPHMRTSLFLHFIPARSRHCSSKYPNNMLFFLSWISASLAWWGWKRHQMAVQSVKQRAQNMFCYERTGKSEQIQNMPFCFFWRVPLQTSSEFQVYASCRLFVTQAAPHLSKIEHSKRP